MRSSLPRDASSCGTISPIGTRAFALRAVTFVLFTVASAQLCSTLAHAQERWLFLPVLTGNTAKSFEAAPVTSELENELRGTGQTVLLNSSAASTFESQQSSESVQLSSDEVKRLSKNIAQASRHLALGELNDAQHAMESVNALSGAARDFLNRDAPRARKIFDNCVMAAYLLERAKQHQPALKQMLDCSRNFPGFEPVGRAYPGEVRRLLEEANVQLSQTQPTSLRVTSAGRNGCTVRLNGIDVGRSPVEITEVRAGPTRVQLECEAGTVGRVHPLELKAGENELAVDPAFDAAVHSQGGLWLAYANDRERDKRAASDGQTIAKVLGVTRDVLLFSSPGALGQDVVVRPGGPGANKEVARAGFAADSGYAKGAPSRVASALVAWLRAQSKAASAGAVPSGASAQPKRDEAPMPVTQPKWDPPPLAAAAPAQPARHGKYTQQHATAGAILAVIGGAGSAVSWVVYADRQNKRRIVSDGMNETKYQRAGVITLTSAALGTTLLSVSEYFWLPDEPEVPALAWVVGGIGVSLGATAIALSFTTSNCQLGDNRVACQHFWSDHFFGPLLFMHALPLISVPAWYGLRMAFRPAGVQLSLSTSVQGLPGLNLQGIF
jgi:hypothetical protein